MNVSVCMPYWERQAELDRSLSAYRAVYSDIEISVCDDGSGVPVKAPGCVVTSLPRKQQPLNPCVPANIAVRASTRDVIVLTNPEIEHRDDVLGPMLEMLTGPMDYIAAKCWDVSRGRWIIGPEVDYGRQRYMIPKGAYFHMCAVMHRSLFDLVGGFDESFRNDWGFEDTDFLWKLREAGATFKLCPKVVYHYATPQPRPPVTNEERLRAKWGHLWN